MSKFHVWGTVTGTKYLGLVEAKTEKEAKELALELETMEVSLCHECDAECEDPVIIDLYVDEAEEN